MWRLCGVHMLPRFDVVIMDESESLLRHFASPTVNAPIQAADAFVKMARMARRGVVCLDAMWGAATWTVLRQSGMSNVLVVNDSMPDAKATRTYRFSNDEATWSGQVVADLAAGLNVVVVSLSAERAMAVHAAGVAVVGAECCLIHTSKTGDELKKELADVGALWSRFRLVVYSPTIAAGVDFSLDHFDRMYVYLCAMSALPATALQMTFRVRKLRDMCVRGLLAPNMRASKDASRPSLTSADMMVWLRWMARRDIPGELQRVTSGGPPVPSAGRQQTLNEMWVNGGQLVVASLPPTSYWSIVTSFVEAERYNAQADYLHGFAELAEAAGHVVVVDRIVAPAACPAAAPDATVGGVGGITAARMLAAPPVESEEELERIRARVVGNTASEEDKWRLYAVSYKAGWGIDRVDEAFVDANGTQPGSPAARLLARVLCPSLRRPRDADTNLSEQTGVFKASLFGFASKLAWGLRRAIHACNMRAGGARGGRHRRAGAEVALRRRDGDPRPDAGVPAEPDADPDVQGVQRAGAAVQAGQHMHQRRVGSQQGQQGSQHGPGRGGAEAQAGQGEAHGQGGREEASDVGLPPRRRGRGRDGRAGQAAPEGQRSRPCQRACPGKAGGVRDAEIRALGRRHGGGGVEAGVLVPG